MALLDSYKRKENFFCIDKHMKVAGHSVLRPPYHWDLRRLTDLLKNEKYFKRPKHQEWFRSGHSERTHAESGISSYLYILWILLQSYRNIEKGTLWKRRCFVKELQEFIIQLGDSHDSDDVNKLLNHSRNKLRTNKRLQYMLIKSVDNTSKVIWKNYIFYLITFYVSSYIFTCRI